ncbi:MAG: glycosyltransferase family 4 protein [Gammaproteobacteria bacterium]|nr:glycosyltransferase family 4 protein [Gammaproteobacteria bacterium]
MNNVRPLTVVQTLPALQAGGVERGTLEIARALVAHGHRSIVISGGGRMVEQLIAEGSEHICWPIGEKSLLTLRLIPRLRRLLREQQVDILHSRSRLPAWISYLAWRGMPAGQRPRFVTTVHGMNSVNRYSAIMMRGERIIAVSETCRRYILDHYPKVDPQRITVIHRGIDDAEFPRGYRPPAEWIDSWYRQFPMLKGRFTIALPGRLTWLKGHHDFIELMSHLKAGNINAYGVIVGGEDPSRKQYAQQLRETIKQRRLDNIVFTGHRSDMREIYSVCDLVLSLTQGRSESFGRTVVEALSLGTPVIGYDHGGVHETLETMFPEGRTPRGDVDQLTQRVTDFIQHPRQVVRPNSYPLQKMTMETLTLYQNIAAGQRQP